MSELIYEEYTDAFGNVVKHWSTSKKRIESDRKKFKKRQKGLDNKQWCLNSVSRKKGAKLGSASMRLEKKLARI